MLSTTFYDKTPKYNVSTTCRRYEESKKEIYLEQQ